MNEEKETKTWIETKKPMYAEAVEYEPNPQKYFTKLRFRDLNDDGEHLILEIKTRTKAESKDQACKAAEAYARKLLTENDWRTLNFHTVEAREETV
jgi:hypothetical protein